MLSTLIITARMIT
ncbi:hypothetical protein YPPY58_2058, partial [Yersinia pestis PY-58]